MRISLNRKNPGKDPYNSRDDLTGRYYYCRRCHTEYYYLSYKSFLSFINNRSKEINIEKKNFLEAILLTNCPVCGKQISMSPGYFCSFNLNQRRGLQVIPYIKSDCTVKQDPYYKLVLTEEDLIKFPNVELGKAYFNRQKINGVKVLDKIKESEDITDLIFAEMAALRKQKTHNEELEKFISKCDKVVSDVKNDYAEEIKSSTDKLIEYINHLITLEVNIVEISKRLPELYKLRRITSDNILYEKYTNIKDSYNAIAESKTLVTRIKIAISDLQNELEGLKENGPDIPKKKKKPKKPTAPTMQTPGLFNKKRILEENQIAEEKYKADMENYKFECQKIERENEKNINLSKQEYEKKLKDIEGQINKKDAELANAINEVAIAEKEYTNLESVALESYVPSESKFEIIVKEIKQAESALLKSFEYRDKLYAKGIIFSKYRNIVALSAFYEYLMAGRCDELEGPKGAYNIYEQECRADLIIAQLTDVLESLEQIKQNQHMLYSKLNEMNSQLKSLSSMMSSALTSIDTIASSTKITAENTSAIKENTSVIAYNTAATAYYSKINAELTNSLGYMVALS